MAFRNGDEHFGVNTRASIIVVKSHDGLTDEDSEALTCNIGDARRPCFFRPHIWINASLYFGRKNERGDFHISLESRKDQPDNFGPEWGVGYGPIRYCRRCKLISCIHLWDSTTDYEVKSGPYYSTHKIVSHCKICDRRIGRGKSGHCHASLRAWELLDEMAVKLGHSKISEGQYGSGWVCETPVAVAEILDARGEEAAKCYIAGLFALGDCQSAIDMIH